ncbi:MAG: twin-arginine translocase TatA/TatE family subunit [Deltaproteobacteria bacterium]|jgi:sec-independent protein translocase protein TatA|nr:twin-arginine translocase TatA/TatE family subunit [Deltaproteobacteria bacterium]
MFGRISPWEIIVIVILVVIIFGGRRLPELGRSLGKGLKNFRESLKGEESKTETQNTTNPDAQSETNPSPNPGKTNEKDE